MEVTATMGRKLAGIFDLNKHHSLKRGRSCTRSYFFCKKPWLLRSLLWLVYALVLLCINRFFTIIMTICEIWWTTVHLITITLGYSKRWWLFVRRTHQSRRNIEIQVSILDWKTPYCMKIIIFGEMMGLKNHQILRYEIILVISFLAVHHSSMKPTPSGDHNC